MSHVKPQVDVGPWLPQYVNPPSEAAWKAYRHARGFRQPLDQDFSITMYGQRELQPTNEARETKRELRVSYEEEELEDTPPGLVPSTDGRAAGEQRYDTWDDSGSWGASREMSAWWSQPPWSSQPPWRAPAGSCTWSGWQDWQNAGW